MKILIFVTIVYLLMTVAVNIKLNKIRAKDYKNQELNIEIKKTRKILNGSAAAIVIINSTAIIISSLL